MRDAATKYLVKAAHGTPVSVTLKHGYATRFKCLCQTNKKKCVGGHAAESTFRGKYTCVTNTQAKEHDDRFSFVLYYT